MKRTSVGLLVLFALSGEWLGAVSNLAVIGQFGLGNVTRHFVRTVELDPGCRAGDCQVVYGNEHYGYFLMNMANRTGANGSSATVDLVPPGYRHPIEFRTYRGGKLIDERRKTFSERIPAAFDDVEIVQEGRFGIPYLLLSNGMPVDGEVPSKDDGSLLNIHRWRVAFLYITNRLGEIVWIHTPSNGMRAYSEYIVAKEAGPGRFALQGCGHLPFGPLDADVVIERQGDCYFEVTDFRGEIQRRIDTASDSLPTGYLHHDFLFNPDDDSVLTLASKKSFAYVLSDGFFSEPRRFNTNVLQRIDLASKKIDPVADFADIFNPVARPFARFRNTKRIPGDFFHTNSIEHVPGQGYLLSFRTHSRVMMVDEKFRRVLWTLGPKKEHTYQVAREGTFFEQHSAKFLANGNLVLFDNGSSGRRSSRILEFRLDDTQGKAHLVRQWAPGMWSQRRGGVYELSSGNLLSYFPSFIYQDRDREAQVRETLVERGKGSRDATIEFTPDGKEIARQTIMISRAHRGYRAVPLQSVDGSPFLGFTSQEAEAAIKLHSH